MILNYLNLRETFLFFSKSRGFSKWRVNVPAIVNDHCILMYPKAVQLWRHACLLALSEAVPVATADPGELCVLPSRLSAQPGGVQPVFRRVQLWGTSVSPVSSQLRSPGSASGPISGPRPPAPQPGLGPGRLLWKGRGFAQAALPAQRPHQVECGGSLWLHQITARSDQDTRCYIGWSVTHCTHTHGSLR